jgi:hypothetical protein
MKFVDVDGTLAKGRRSVTGADNLSEGDVQDARKLTELLRNVMRRLTTAESTTAPEPTEFEVNAEAGEPVTLQHGFNSPVRFYVTSWSNPGAQVGGVFSYVARSFCVGAFAVTAGSNTVGCSYRMKRRRTIAGVRFAWAAAGGARTLRVVLWNNTTGAVIAETTQAVLAGDVVYEARFATPVTDDLTGTDITVSLWDQAGAVAVFNNSVTYLAMEMGPDLTLVNGRLFSAGNNRPTGNSAGGHYPVEPILEEPGPEFSVNTASTTSNILVLNAHGSGRAIIRVEPSQYTPRYT